MALQNNMPTKEQNKRYYEKHRQKMIDKSIEYRKLHREEIKLYLKEYRKKNLAKLKQNQKNYYHNHKEERSKIQRFHNAFQKYGITEGEYNEILKKQNGCCAVCKKPQKDFSKSFAIDHDHKTGKIRGLLCHGCNVILGFSKEDTKILKNAIKYLGENQQ